MKKRTVKFSFLIALLIIGIASYMFSTTGCYYKRYSPDNQYSIYASKYRHNKFTQLNLIATRSSDASGRVYLYDEIEKRIIYSSHIGMVGNSQDIKWFEDYARDKATIYWKLPRKIHIDSTVVEPNE